MPGPVPGEPLYHQEREKYIVSAEEARAFEDVDCIMVLGCGVRPEAVPQGMLNDRLVQESVFIRGCLDRLLMSGDHGKVNYDEVNLMKQFAIDRECLREHFHGPCRLFHL